MKNTNPRTLWVIVVAIALLLVALILFLGNQSFTATERVAFDEFNQRQLVLAKAATAGIELYFQTLAGAIRALGQIPEVQQFDEALTRRELQQKFNELQTLGVNDVGVLDATGVLRYSAVAPQIEGTDFSRREYFQEAKEMTSSDMARLSSPKSYIIELIEFNGVEAGQKGVLIAVPMVENASDENYPAPSGRFAGVVVSTLRLDTITQKFIAPIQASKRGHAFLIDDEHNVLWSPDSSFFGKNLLAESEGFPAFQQIVETASTGASDTAEYSYYKFEDASGKYTKDEIEEKLIAYVPIRLGNELWAIGVWAPKEDANQLVQSAYFRQLLVVGLSVLIIILGSSIALVVSFRFSKSLEREVETKVRELRESEDRYRRLVELSPDAIGIHSEDKIVFMNNAGAKLFGAENPEQLIEKSVWDFVLPENREIVKERYRQMREKGTQLPPIEQRVIRLDGTSVDVEVSATSFAYKGKPAILALFHDITKRKQAKEALEAAHAFLQSITDGVAHPIMVIGADYRVKMMNRAAREFSIGDIATSEPVYCYQVSHQCEAPCNGIEHPCPMEQVRQLGRPITVVHQHYQANGEPRFVEIVASPLWEADGTFQGIIESIRDVTDRQEAEEVLAQQVQGLIHTDDELENFANKVVKSLQDFFAKLPPD